MSEIKKIGMYTTDEILEHLTEGEGRGFLGRSMYDAIYFKIEELENQLQQKESIIKDIKSQLEYITTHKLYNFKYDDEELFEIVTDEKAKDELLKILDNVGDK